MSLIGDALRQVGRQQGDLAADHAPPIEITVTSRAPRGNIRSPLRVLGATGTLLVVGAGIAFAARAGVARSVGEERPLERTQPVVDSAPIVVLQAPAPQEAERVPSPPETPTPAPAATVQVQVQSGPRLRTAAPHITIPRIGELDLSAVLTVDLLGSHTPDTSAAAVAVSAPSLSADSLFRLAYAEQMRNRLDDAQALYERAIATRHASAEVYNDYGVLLLARGDRAVATKMFREALNRDDRSVEAWVNLGDSFQAMGRQSDAISAYVRANRLDPTRSAVKVRIARLFADVGDTAAARRYRDEMQRLIDTLSRVP